MFQKSSGKCMLYAGLERPLGPSWLCHTLGCPCTQHQTLCPHDLTILLLGFNSNLPSVHPTEDTYLTGIALSIITMAKHDNQEAGHSDIHGETWRGHGGADELGLGSQEGKRFAASQLESGRKDGAGRWQDHHSPSTRSVLPNPNGVMSSIKQIFFKSQSV